MDRQSDEEELLDNLYDEEQVDKDDIEYRLFIHLKCAKNLSVRKQNGSVNAFVKFLLGSKVVHKIKVINKGWFNN